MVDMCAAKAAFGFMLEHLATTSILRDWRHNTRQAYWEDPESKDWKYPRADLPIVINDQGEEVAEDVQRKVWWERLIKESDDNLREEDKAASLIQAVLRGRHARILVSEALTVEILSQRENYRFQECHGGC
jgi:hypothetical protein